MENNRMDLLIFLNELAAVHRDLSENVSLCYNMYNNTLFSEDCDTEIQGKIETPEYRCKPAEVQLAYDEFFVEGSSKKKSVEYIFLHGMYFLPGEEEGSILLGKDFFVIIHNSGILQKFNVVNLDFRDSASKEIILETPVHGINKKNNRLWKWLFLIVVITVTIWFLFYK